MNLIELGRSLCSNLCRFRKWFRECNCNRTTVVHLVSHVSLSILDPVLISHGIPVPVAVVSTIFTAIIVANAIDDCLEKGTGS